VLDDASRHSPREAVDRVLSAGQRLPGFGHSVYKRGDPRLAPLLESVRALPDATGRMRVVEQLLVEAGRRLGQLPNVDFGLGALTFVAGLPRDASLFAVARIAGWAAHYEEEKTERPVRYRGITTRA
jgi:citrate synthase